MAVSKKSPSRVKRAAKKVSNHVSEWSVAKKIGAAAALVAVPVAAVALARAIARKRKQAALRGKAKKS